MVLSRIFGLTQATGNGHQCTTLGKDCRAEGQRGRFGGRARSCLQDSEIAKEGGWIRRGQGIEMVATTFEDACMMDDLQLFCFFAFFAFSWASN